MLAYIPALRDKTMYLQLQYKCMMGINTSLVLDGHKCIPGIKWNKDVHSYLLFFLKFCFALLILCLSIQHVIITVSDITDIK